MTGEVEDSREIVSKEKGLTWRSMLAFVFIVFIIHPAIVYNWLVNGLWGIGLGSWAVILLWVGLTRLLGSPLNSKEIFVIRIFESIGLVTTGYFFAYLLRNQYYVNSEIAQIFGLQDQVPRYFSPLGEDYMRSVLNRTFLDISWVQPILVNVGLPVLLAGIANYTLGLLAFRLYVQEEKLEFPIASWDASAMKVFGEREKDKIRIITLAIIAGIVYGSVTYGLTSILGVTLFPRLLLDFTSVIETMVPGASLSFTTDLIPYMVGLILPVRYTVFQFIASVGLYFFGTAYVTQNNLWPAESEWVPGQGILWLYARSTVYFWNSFTIGWGIAAAAIPLLVRYKAVLRAFTSVRGSLDRSAGKWFSSKYLLLIYFLTAAASVLSLKVLVPGFPLWILILFTMGMSLIMTLLQTHSAGVTVGFNVPYLRETLIYYSGYRGLDIWFIPQDMTLFLGGSNITQQLKQAQIVGVDTREYTKTYFLIIGLGIAGSALFTSLFWNLNPIPGWAYPYTISAWPVEAMNFWRWQSWLWTGYLFRRDWILTGFSLSAALYMVSDFVFHLPSIPIAMMTGMLQFPHLSFAQFFGSLASLAIRRFVGPEFWDSNKGYLWAGMFMGDGLVSTILLITALVGRSTWLKPY